MIVEIEYSLYDEPKESKHTKVIIIKKPGKPSHYLISNIYYGKLWSEYISKNDLLTLFTFHCI